MKFKEILKTWHFLLWRWANQQMSGLEFFLDGGATFAGLVSAGAALVGYKQHKGDDSELVEDEEELEHLRKNLGESCTSACAAHSAITAAWGQPLSLFRAEGNQLGAPWLEILQTAQALVEKAAELEDLADVYDAQLQLAIAQQRSLRRSPLLLLERKLDELSLVLTSQIPAVVFAKEANTYGDVAMKSHAMAAAEAAKCFNQALSHFSVFLADCWLMLRP